MNCQTDFWEDALERKKAYSDASAIFDYDKKKNRKKGGKFAAFEESPYLKK